MARAATEARRRRAVEESFQVGGHPAAWRRRRPKAGLIRRADDMDYPFPLPMTWSWLTSRGTSFPLPSSSTEAKSRPSFHGYFLPFAIHSSRSPRPMFATSAAFGASTAVMAPRSRSSTRAVAPAL
jgi:hypothetical protein